MGGGEGRGRRHGRAARDVPDRLPDAGPDPEARLHGATPMRAVERLAADCADGPAIGIGGAVCRGRAALQRVLRPAGRAGDGARPEAPPAERRRVRREAGLRTGPITGPYAWVRCASARRSARTPGSRMWPRRWPRAGRRSCSSRTARPIARGKLDVRHEPDGRPRRRDGAAAGLPEHGGRAGRPGLRRRVLRAEPGRARWPCRCRCSKKRWPTSISTRRRTAGGRGQGDKARSPDAGEAGLPRDGRWRCATICAKSGFRKVLLGLSGGIDSAIVAAIAADAIGPENVRCVMLPSEFTSAQSLEDAAAVGAAPWAAGSTRCRSPARARRWARRWRRCSQGPHRRT